MIKLMAVIKNKLQYGDTVIPYTVTQTKRKKTMEVNNEIKTINNKNQLESDLINGF